MNKHLTPAANNLFSCVQEFANSATNPIVQLLDGAQSIKPFQHYPEKPFSFANKTWKCFYHCHDFTDKNKHEHGHLHFFTLINGQWSHVVALSMNDTGQPINWFSTNKWVTEGDWLSSNDLQQQIKLLDFQENHTLLERWFTSLLLFYKPQIESLITQRDTYIDSLSSKNVQDVFSDKDLYQLSHTDVDLTQDLAHDLEFESNTQVEPAQIH